MIQYLLPSRIFTFLSIFLLATTCYGQAKLTRTMGTPNSNNVNSSLQDKAGNYWFGTTSEGLYKYDGKTFMQFTEADGLSNSVSCLFEDKKDGKIWIGTSEGLFHFDARLPEGQGKTFTKIEIPLPKYLPPNKNSTQRTVFSIMQDKNGKLWLATIDGVYIYDGNSFTPFKISDNEGGLMSSNHNVERILEDKAGNIWFGGRGNKGVYRYDARLADGQGKTITNLQLPELNGQDWACPILQDKDGNIWFYCWGGAYRYDGKSFTSFTKNDGLASVAVMRIIQDKKGNLWFGGDSGLTRYDGKTFTSFSTKEGLRNPGVWSILEDKSGKLWVGTRGTGLELFDGKEFRGFSQ